MIWNTISKAVGELFGLVGDHFEGQRKIKLAEVEAEIALAAKRASAEIDWDLMWADQAKTSWKDEWFVLLHSIPVIMAFIPSMAPYVAQGFEALSSSAPDWFITFYGAGVAASFGIRGLKDVYKSRSKKELLADIVSSKNQ